LRDYDPQIGRYIESDPIGIAAGLNTYAYVENNPVIYVDPKGMIQWKGSQSVLGAAFEVGATRLKFELTTDCVNGKRGYAEVVAGGPTVGFGVKVSATGVSQVVFEDYLSHINPFVFEGLAKFVVFSWAAGTMGYSWQAIELGGARLIGGGFQMGYDASATGGIGYSRIEASRIEDCCK
jgi:hypothetical protein